MPPLSGALLPYGLCEQLRVAGFHNVEDVVGQDELVLAHRTRLSIEEVRDLQRTLRMGYAAAPLPATLLLRQARAQPEPLSLGLDELNQLLGGGFRAGEVTELVGSAASGKTALCLQACASVLAEPTSTVAFIDSSNAFTPTRLLPLIRNGGIPEAIGALSRLRCWRIHDGQALLSLLHELLDVLNQKGNDYTKNMRLIVVDSVASLLSPLLSSTSLGHSLVSGVSRALRLLAVRHNLVILVTNYVVSGDDDIPKSIKPAMGESWGMTCSTRLFLERQPRNGLVPQVYKAVLLKSSQRACNSSRVFFGIGAQGLVTQQEATSRGNAMEEDEAYVQS